MADWVFMLLNVALILAGFLWGEKIVKVFIKEHKYKSNIADFLGFVGLVTIIAILHQPLAQTILDMNRDIALLAALGLFVAAFFKYDKVYIKKDEKKE